MGLLRSEDVDMYQIIVPKDDDWDIMNALGHINCLHFIELNKEEQPHHLRYFNQVKRAEEAEKIAHEIEAVCRRYHVEMKAPENIDTFLQEVGQYRKNQRKAAHLLFDQIESDIIEKHAFLKKQQDGLEKMVKVYKQLLGKINVLAFAQDFLKHKIHHQTITEPTNVLDTYQPLLTGDDLLKLCYLGGTIRKVDILSFKRMIFRSTRGKAFPYFFDMKIDLADRIKGINDHNEKSVFIIMFEEGFYVKDRINRICAAVSSDPVYEISREEMFLELRGLFNQKDEAKTLIQQTKVHLKEYLIRINQMNESEYSLIQIFKWFIIKEKQIYSEMNKFKDGDKILLGLFWCPSKMKEKLNEKVQEIQRKKNLSSLQISLVSNFNEDTYIRPTYIETNDFTWPFQEIVNTYGIPMYKEINPSIFTTVTFPFLFGIMFGDVMHGTILFTVASIICFSKRTPGTIMGDLGKVRYLLLLMGFFSFYCGLMYNDFTSVPLNIFGHSCYEVDEETKKVTAKSDCVYPVGVDPNWYIGKNELTYMNSLKMKLSVIFGVSQMALGVLMKAFNNVQQKKAIDFFFEFVPQIVLLVVLFGFMDLLIVVKWLTDYSQVEGAKPPSVISTMIVMCLGFGEQSDPRLQEDALIPNQTLVMRMIIITAFICVPLMLFVKPIYLNSQNKHHQHNTKQIEEGIHYTAINDEHQHEFEHDSKKKTNSLDVLSMQSDEVQKAHTFGDLFIHQLIETIEFVLGTVSNTASYLRLWALSLAHSQLAKVFFDNTLKPGLETGNFYALLIGFYVFLTFTVTVLMMMDLMEAFLHTLRLHWVEFQNKFYKGGGVRFNPFSIEALLQNAKLKEEQKWIQEEKEDLKKV